MIYKLLRMNMLQNLFFVSRYLLSMHPSRPESVDVSTIEAAQRVVFPDVRLIGDKHPDYVYVLDELTQANGLYCIVIYRDVRDVASSALEKARTAWRGYDWAQEHFGTAEGVAERWVHSISLMRRHADKVHLIRYEDLVADPRAVLTKLGEYLDVDSDRFDYHIIRADSVARYRDYLSKEELEDVMRIAGPTMERLGYDV